MTTKQTQSTKIIWEMLSETDLKLFNQTATLQKSRITLHPQID